MFASQGFTNDFSSLDAKLESLGNDIEIYDFNDDPGLGLDESLNELNDDTFGGDLPVQRDFDFSGTGGRVPAAQPSHPERAAAQPELTPWNAPAWDSDPLLGGGRSKAAQTSQPQRNQPSASRQHKTLAEIEAEMFATRQSPLASAPQQQQPRPSHKTLEEIEAEMLHGRVSSSPQLAPQQAPQQMNRGQFNAFGQPQGPPGMQGFPPAGMMQHDPRFMQGGPMSMPPGMQIPPQFQQQMGPPPMHMPPHQHHPHPSPLHHPQPPPMQRIPSPEKPNVPQQVQQQPQRVSQDVFQQLLRDGGDPNLFPPLGTQGPVVPLLAQQIQRGHSPSSSGQMSLGQLHALRINLVARPSPENAEVLKQIDALIMEAEFVEASRRRRGLKIASMASHNNIMTNNEKDFITRIQLSQLLNTLGPGGDHDPLREDFYFTVYQAIRGARSQQQQNASAQTGGKRRQQAMMKMAMQVQRIVDDARKKPRATQLSLDGALGKIAIRTRAAPRKLLQVDRSGSSASISDKTGDTPSPSSATPKLARLQSNNAQSGQEPAMSRWKVLVTIEKLYDIVLEMEQLRRMQPQLSAHSLSGAPDADDSLQELEKNKKRYDELLISLWSNLKVGEPVDISNPHPFISILTPSKGKKLLPRILRHINEQQTLLMFTLMIATFSQIDVVRRGPQLDSESLFNKPADGRCSTTKDLEGETDLFLNTIIPAFLNTLAKQPLRMVGGLLGLLVERNNIVRVAQTKPGIAFLTLFMSRAELLKQSAQAAEVPADIPPPTEEELQHWTVVFNNLFGRLQGQIQGLFPSTRALANLPFGAGSYMASGSALRPDIDLQDQPIWSFLAAVAVCSDPEQQQALVMDAKDKVLECVTAASQKNTAPELAAMKIKNANLLLHALGLDAAQIKQSDGA